MNGKADHGAHGPHGRGTDRLLHRDVTDRILAAYYNVYRELGWGFVESVYTGAMRIEFDERNLQVELETSVVVHYCGKAVGVFRTDMIVDKSVLVELKAVSALAEAHEQQVLNYLKATSIEVGLLLNFGPRPSFKRYLLTNDKKNLSV